VSTPTCEGGVLAPVALVLSAGELYCAERVRSLAPRSPLVVLSTCESAGGRFVDAEGLFGLSRTFLRGSRNLLVTLWPVEDGIAARAALLFHEAWAAGRSPSRAARDMRRGLRAEGYPSSEWGAYRLSGRD
jgi:CHAT domain-containing protein